MCSGGRVDDDDDDDDDDDESVSPGAAMSELRLRNESICFRVICR
jgi:hypothetical protein